MVLLSGEAILRRTDVPYEILYAEEEPKEESQDFKEARNSFERCFLCAALHRHRGVISQVAEAVGLSRKSLYAKLENLDIDYQRYRFCSRSVGESAAKFCHLVFEIGAVLAFGLLVGECPTHDGDGVLVTTQQVE